VSFAKPCAVHWTLPGLACVIVTALLLCVAVKNVAGPTTAPVGSVPPWNRSFGKKQFTRSRNTVSVQDSTPEPVSVIVACWFFAKSRIVWKRLCQPVTASTQRTPPRLMSSTPPAVGTIWKR
jgi:hypothetical protein